jgi:hypothetical protein
VLAIAQACQAVERRMNRYRRWLERQVFAVARSLPPPFAESALEALGRPAPEAVEFFEALIRAARERAEVLETA